MPTLLLVNGLRFFFYSNESQEPIHVHVTKGEANGKIWLEPSVEAAYLIGFNNSDKINILKIVQENSENFKKKWNEYFSK